MSPHHTRWLLGDSFEDNFDHAGFANPVVVVVAEKTNKVLLRNVVELSRRERDLDALGQGRGNDVLDLEFGSDEIRVDLPFQSFFVFVPRYLKDLCTCVALLHLALQEKDFLFRLVLLDEAFLVDGIATEFNIHVERRTMAKQLV